MGGVVGFAFSHSKDGVLKMARRIQKGMDREKNHGANEMKGREGRDTPRIGQSASH